MPGVCCDFKFKHDCIDQEYECYNCVWDCKEGAKMCNYFDKDVELGELHECMYCNFCENYIHCIYSGCEKWCAVSNCKCTQSPCKYYECVFNPLEISEKKCYNDTNKDIDKVSPNQR